MTDAQFQELKAAIEQNTIEVNKVSRRQDEILKDLSLIFADRNILEDLQAGQVSLKQIILSNQEHQDLARNSLQSDVKKVEFAVTDAVEGVKTSIEDKTVIVKSTSSNIFQKLKKYFPKGGEK